MICFFCKKKLLRETPVHEGLHAACFCSWFNLDSLETFQDVVARSTEQSTDAWASITSSFFHGKFRKYSAKLGSRHYILKVQQKEVPELPATEFLCNQLADHLGLQVPKHYLVRFQGKLVTFVCENFIQDYPESNLIHIYRFLDQPQQFTCEGLLKVIETHVGHYHDSLRFVELCLFDALIGNHDRHGRNLGLLQTKEGYSLAPFYDNPSYLALEDPLLLEALHEPRGAIPTKETREPTMKDYVKEWKRLGFSDEVRAFKERVDLPMMHFFVQNSFIAKKRKKALIKLMDRRFEELSDAI